MMEQRALDFHITQLEFLAATVSNVWNSKNWKQVVGKDPTTGVYGLKIDDISGFGERGADSFIVKFKWCSDNSCNKDLGVVAYKAGQCVDYDTLGNQTPQPPLPPQSTSRHCYYASTPRSTLVYWKQLFF